MDFEVYLINANLSPSKKISGCDNPGLFFIQQSLNSSGIKSHILPEKPVDFLYNDKKGIMGFEVVTDEIVPNLSDSSIIGISAWTQAYPFLENIAHAIKKEFPNAYVIGGGPHFTTHQDTKEEFLKSPLDAYVVGGSAFKEFCENLKNKKILLNDGNIYGAIPTGLYYRVNNQVVGIGRGGFPEINLDIMDNYPFQELNKDGVKHIVISLPSSNKCPNGCEYCASPKNDMDVAFLKSYLTHILEDPNLDGDKFIVNFEGNNPLIEENRKDTEELMAHIIDTGKNSGFGFFLDSCLFTGENYAYLRDLVINNEQTFELFVGMDVFRENNSRKLRGVMRTQQQLDCEFEGLTKFMIDVDKKDKKTSIVPSHIFFPDDDLETYKEAALKMYSLALLEKKLNNVELMFRTNILTPFPGTKIRKNYRDRIDESIPWGCYSVTTNVWKDAPLLSHLENSIYLHNLCDKKNILDLEPHALDIAHTYYPYAMARESEEPEELMTRKNLAILLTIAKHISDNIKKTSNLSGFFFATETFEKS